MNADQLRELAIFELLDSSESSSDDEEEMALLMQNDLVEQRKLDINIKNFIENVVNKCSDAQLQSDFRLSRAMCNFLIDRYESSRFYKIEEASYDRGRSRKSAQTHFLSFLWYAANKSTLRETGRIFDMSLSKLHHSMECVMDFLLSIAPSVIVFLRTEMEKLHAAQGFSQISGIPGAVGAIDGCLINIRCPANKIPSTYINRHDQISMTLQGICDSEKRFIDVFTRVSSKMHDSRVFQESFIYPIVHQSGDNYHLIGDGAYALSTNVLTPYRDYGQLTREQRNFNYHFCRSRVKIENTFALLQSRFRSLIRLSFHTPLKDAKFIISTCVLHNLGIEDLQLVMDRLRENEIRVNEENNLVPIRLDRAAGELKRHDIAATSIRDRD